MFGLFKPKYPVSLREKVWAELRMADLANEFGLERMLSAGVVLPTNDYFPDTYNGSEADAKRLLDRVCKFMGADVTKIDFRVRADDEMSDAAGFYEPGTRAITVIQSQLDEKKSLIAILAHEVAHDLLLHGKQLRGDEDDHEQITDLLTVFLGMGVFAANTAVKQTVSHDATWHYWSIRKLGYLTARVYGYSFALREWIRGDINPRWTWCLGDDAKYALRDGLKYLTKTDDSLFRRDFDKKYLSDRPITELVSDLAHPSETVCVAALWSLGEQKEKAADSVGALIECLRERSTAVRSEAALALGSIGEPAREATSVLMGILRSPEAENRAAAATAIGLIRPALDHMGPDESTLYDELAILQGDQSRNVTLAAADALTSYGQGCSQLAPRLLSSLKRALIECDFLTVDHYLRVLMAIIPDIDQFLERELATDAELFEHVTYSLNELRLQHSR